MNGLSIKSLIPELRRRRTFRTAGYYIVGAWLVMQAADVFFPAWGLPDAAKNVLLVTAILGFPLVLVFGWFYDITTEGIVRTPAAGMAGSTASLPLQRRDYLLLGVLGVVAGLIVYEGLQDILTEPRQPLDELPVLEKIADSIAVLPFANTSNDADNEAFCDGVSEQILHKLSGYAELHVIGRTSSFSFKGSDYRIPRIAALLGVKYLLQGSVRRDGNKLRILASLVDDTGTQVWSDSYDRELESVFALQDDIADEVATKVVPRIVPQKNAGYQPDLRAYQQYLVGKDLLWRRQSGAAAAFARAVELDPNFADAQADLAIAELLFPPDLERASRAIDTALSLQPGLPRAIAARGLLLSSQTPPDYVGAERLLREALALSPDMVDAMNWLGGALTAQGKNDEAFEVMQRAARIDPLHGAVASNVAAEYARRGDVTSAEKMLQRLVDLPEPMRSAYLSLRNLYRDTGQLVKVNTLEKRQAIIGMHIYYGLAENYAMLGMWETAERWMQLSRDDFPDWAWAPVYPTLLPTWQGRYADAVDQYRLQSPFSDELQPIVSYFYGECLAQAGDFDGAVGTLEPVLAQTPVNAGDLWQTLGDQALAWAYARTGRPDEARKILEDIERGYRQMDAQGVLHNSNDLFGYAQNALQLGDEELALDRLQRAVDAGWRQYLIQRHDPRWTPLRDNSRYATMMQGVVDDLEKQRAEVERIDGSDDFMDRFESARRLRN